jgi:hypothetical protein
LQPSRPIGRMATGDPDFCQTRPKEASPVIEPAGSGRCRALIVNTAARSRDSSHDFPPRPCCTMVHRLGRLGHQHSSAPRREVAGDSEPDALSNWGPRRAPCVVEWYPERWRDNCPRFSRRTCPENRSAGRRGARIGRLLAVRGRRPRGAAPGARIHLRPIAALSRESIARTLEYHEYGGLEGKRPTIAPVPPPARSHRAISSTGTGNHRHPHSPPLGYR